MKEDESQHGAHIQQAEIDKLFSQLTAAEVDDFYQAYQLWRHRQRVTQIQQQIQVLHEKQAQNAARMQLIEPSAIALSAIAQLRFHGVDDVDLLDRMLDRGEEWLDNTMQLLARCEALNVIQGNYAQWCEHALEGAYEWMWSMNDASLSTYFDVEQPATPQSQKTTRAASDSADVTEAQLLQKLMSEEGEEKSPARPQARITQPLPVISPDEVLAQSEAFMPLHPGLAGEANQDEEAAASDSGGLQQNDVPADTHESPRNETATDAVENDQFTPGEVENTPTPPSGPDQERAATEEIQTESEAQEQTVEAPISATNLPEEQLSDEELQKQVETEEGTFPEKEPQGQFEEEEKSLPDEEAAEQVEMTEQQPIAVEQPISAEEVVQQGQWPYVYPEAQNGQSLAQPATAAETRHDHQPVPEQTAEDSRKPHATADGRSRGLLKRSLDRFLRR
ncbi:hypothetical protein [Dictyobacter aurantiacus]|uniref:Uncharacterized protein n=1 Tax=Dictyobacter aurantiacus TaxID=1936993 RepID=A0A401ZH67_9CHLR|nr:hypothetical protein [Dictyobacter aurantiacus]GCE06209.1 hypothetical protein KDAU_35380 [Dictyobacter aurantiacus]